MLQMMFGIHYKFGFKIDLNLKQVLLTVISINQALQNTQ